LPRSAASGAASGCASGPGSEEGGGIFEGVAEGKGAGPTVGTSEGVAVGAMDGHGVGPTVGTSEEAGKGSEAGREEGLGARDIGQSCSRCLAAPLVGKGVGTLIGVCVGSCVGDMALSGFSRPAVLSRSAASVAASSMPRTSLLGTAVGGHNALWRRVARG
jgi:hypothetical protein